MANEGTSVAATGPGKVVELFAGVGGFRLGLEGRGTSLLRGVTGDRDHASRWRVVWSNQWEPGLKRQDASSCYVGWFGQAGHVCEDIERFLDWAIDGDEDAIPPASRVPLPGSGRIDLLVGGFPCQDYSVAKPLSQASGIEGKKGVLWWQIHRLIEDRLPTYVLLENVDRLLKSPADQRGRDFAVMLACFAVLGYDVQWRVVNAADYGFPQRRRRVFILAERAKTKAERDKRRKNPLTIEQAWAVLRHDGTLARALPVGSVDGLVAVGLGADPAEPGADPFAVSETFGLGHRSSVWSDAGVMRGGFAWTATTRPGRRPRRHAGRRKDAVLRDVLVRDDDVPPEYVIPRPREKAWRTLKGAKHVPRVDKRTGYAYTYSEGGVAFPDPLDRPSRTILTGEGGTSPSRFKHVVRMSDGRLRRLLPVELERLQGFPDDWTRLRADGSVITDGRRAFFMGNALVIGLVEAIGRELAEDRASGRPTLGGASRPAPARERKEPVGQTPARRRTSATKS